MTSFTITDLVKGGFCVGCGACGAICDGIDIRPTDLGTFEPDLSQASAETLRQADAVCPFSDTTPDETATAQPIFAAEEGSHDPRIGKYSLLGAGSITDDAQRETSSSGGLTNWILRCLLERGLVDGVIHVVVAPAASHEIFGYSISRRWDEMAPQGKSKYYASNISEVFRRIRGDGRRYAFVGVPCFVTAARHVAAADPVYAEQLAYFVGLVCGHMKSTRFAELMAWEVGVPPDQLALVDFRLKARDRPSSDYSFAAQSTDGRWLSAPTRSLYGSDWGKAFFQLKACDYCDDIFAETADVALGDAWLPAYEKDWRGTNVLVSRRKEINELIEKGLRDGEIRLDRLSPDAICQSQGGNFRHRRDGLAVRLQDAARRGEATPRKRVAPGAKVNFLRRRLIRQRQASAATSHLAFARARKAKDLAVFHKEMAPHSNGMENTYRLMRWFSPGQIKAMLSGLLKKRK